MESYAERYAMDVSELTGLELDRWVANAKGEAFGACYSTDWSHGGPIIEREQIATWPAGNEGWRALHPKNLDGAYLYGGVIDAGSFDGTGGPTPLIAAMRAYVASKFGDEVPAITPGKDVR